MVDLLAGWLAGTQVWALLLSVGLVVMGWLLGLIVSLRGSAPRERARIIEAYGRALPGRRGRAPRPVDGRRWR